MAKKKTKAVVDNIADFGVDTAKGGVIFTTASIIRAIGTLALLIILARLLQPANYGLYAIIIALSGLLGLNTDFGVGSALKKKLPEAKTNYRILELINNAYFGAVSIAIVIAIIGIIFSGYIATNIYKNAILTYPIIIGVVAIIFSTLFSATMSSLLGLRKNKEAGIGYITYSLSQLIASTILVLFGYGIFGALTGLLISLIIAFLITFTFLLKHIKYKIIKPTKDVLKELFGFSTPIFASNAISNGTLNLGVILLGAVASPFIVGNYGAAVKLGSFAEVIIIAITQVLLPTYSYAASNKKLAEKSESIFNSSIYYTLLILLPLLVYFISISNQLIFIFLSKSYIFAPFYFSIVAVGIVTGIVFRYGGTLVISYGKVKAYTIYIIGTAMIVIVLLTVLTPTFKVYGVLLALYIIGPILYDIAFLRFMSNELHVNFSWDKPLKIVLAVIIILPLLLYINTIISHGRYIMVINAIITLVLYPPILALLKGIDNDNLKFVESISNKLHVNFIMKYLFDYTKIFMSRQ
ncbi:MAG: oligosaccharide flippase family protein [Thaumarchaeota archaeon]|nr:oligosaccharide flippase family protein [Nitrososphaerota archaeon]